MIMYVAVKDLPAAIVKALAGVDYGRTDIEVKAASTVVLSASGGKGTRAFVSLVNLETGAARTVYGSWGGPNMFDRSNPVDNDDQSYPLPGNGVAITGSHGGGRPVYATLHVPASMVDRILPAAGEVLTDEEQHALYCYKALKSGKYRTDEMRRLNVRTGTVDSLVERGYLERNRAGATKITTKGKNAFDGTRGGRRGGY